MVLPHPTPPYMYSPRTAGGRSAADWPPPAPDPDVPLLPRPSPSPDSHEKAPPPVEEPPLPFPLPLEEVVSGWPQLLLLLLLV